MPRYVKFRVNFQNWGRIPVTELKTFHALSNQLSLPTIEYSLLSPLCHFNRWLYRAENLYKRTHSALDWSSFKSLRNHYHKLILSAKKQYYSHLVSSSSENPLRPWQTVNRLLNRKSSSPLPSSTLVRQLCLFLHRQNFQTSDLSNQHFPCCVSTHTFSSINTSCFFLPSGRHQNLKSIRSCSTLQINSLI